MTEPYALDLPTWLSTATGAASIPYAPDAVALDGTTSRSRAGLFGTLAGALDLPEHFGRNWDALSDSLRDRVAESPLTLVIDSAAELLADEPHQQFATLLTVLGHVALAAPARLRVVLRVGPEQAQRLRHRLAAVALPR